MSKPILAINFLILTNWCAPAAVAHMGAPECPCINSSSPLFNATRFDVVARGRPETYGLLGCRTYDANYSETGCAANEEEFCLNPWCWVDPTICAQNKELCEDAGGAKGSSVSPYCRARRFAYLDSTLTYSYETCDSMNRYDTRALTEPIAGTVLKVAAKHDEPWLLKPNPPTEFEWTGPHMEFFKSALSAIQPAPILHVYDHLSTSVSLDKYPSTYTACVHDVAIGHYDICVADLWRTEERARMVEWTPPVRTDHFYLVVPRIQAKDTFQSRLAKPFAPFAPTAWVAIAMTLMGVTVVLWISRVVAGFDATQPRREFAVSSASDFCATTAQIWDDFLQGASSIEPDTKAHRFFRMGFQFFLLVTMCSYTASLASLLVVKRQDFGRVSGIEEEILRGLTTCVHFALEPTFSLLYPEGKFLSANSSDFARLIYSGKCTAAIMEEARLDKYHAGQMQEVNCKKVADGEWTAEEAHCTEGFPGSPRNDCDLIRIGDIIISMPIAYPISSDLAHSMSWAFTQRLSAGGWQHAVRANIHLLPKSQCNIAEGSDEAMTATDLSGSIFIASMLGCVGIFCFVFDSLRMWWKPEDRAADDASRKPEDAAADDATRQPEALAADDANLPNVTV